MEIAQIVERDEFLLREDRGACTAAGCGNGLHNAFCRIPLRGVYPVAYRVAYHASDRMVDRHVRRGDVADTPSPPREYNP